MIYIIKTGYDASTFGNLKLEVLSSSLGTMNPFNEVCFYGLSVVPEVLTMIWLSIPINLLRFEIIDEFAAAVPDDDHVKANG